MTARALTAMSLGIPAFMLSKVLAPAFYARQDTRTPMRIAIRTVAVNVGLTVLLVTPLWWYEVPGAHAGIALATALAGIFHATWMWRALSVQGLFQPQPGWSRFLLQLGGRNVLIDPIFGNWCILLKRLRQPGLRIEDLPPGDYVRMPHHRVVLRQQAFGFTYEELNLLVAPMARTGAEALGSMGTDTPIAVLSARPRMVADQRLPRGCSTAA